MDLYYMIWIDAIVFERAKFRGERSWKTYTMFTVCFSQSLNLFAIVLVLGYFDIFIPTVNIDLFPGTMSDSALEGFVLIGWPPIVLNYLLIFWRHRYRKLVKRFKHSRGRLITTYLFSSIAIVFMAILLAISKVGLAHGDTIIFKGMGI